MNLRDMRFEVGVERYEVFYIMPFTLKSGVYIPIIHTGKDTKRPVNALKPLAVET